LGIKWYRKDEKVKPIHWVGPTKKDLSKFATPIKQIFGYALYLAQRGLTHPDTKLMKGKLRAVTEIRVDQDGDTFRAVYTAKIGEVVYALHAFQKKSAQGTRTPQRHLDLIAQRLKEALRYHERVYTKKISAQSPARTPRSTDGDSRRR
jgi:phage-related protein